MNKKKQPDDPQVDDSWLLPYADMLTLLLALFIILFAMSKIDAQKYKKLTNIFKSEFSSSKMHESQGSPVSTIDEVFKEDEEANEESEENDEENEKKILEELNQLKKLQEEINAYIYENNLAEILGTQLSDEGLLITILTDVSFDSGSAQVKNEGKEIAREIANFIYTDPPHQIIISGHADDRPMYNDEFKSNWELSVMRAVNFMGLLLENKQLEPKRFSAKGYGEYHPIVPNTNEANRAKNRRVEVLILPNYDLHKN